MCVPWRVMMKLSYYVMFLVIASFCSEELKAGGIGALLAREAFEPSHLKRLFQRRSFSTFSPFLGQKKSFSQHIKVLPKENIFLDSDERKKMTKVNAINPKITSFFSYLESTSLKQVMSDYKDDDLSQLKSMLQETQDDNLLTNITNGETPYGMSLNVAEYWQQRSALLKVAIILGDMESKEEYQEYISHFSDNIQLPQVVNEKNNKEEIRAFYWSLLSFEDPIARKYLAQNYKTGVIVPLNHDLGHFWENKYNDIFPLPSLIRTKILNETLLYPFKRETTSPSEPQNWKTFFPTKTYHTDLSNL